MPRTPSISPGSESQTRSVQCQGGRRRPVAASSCQGNNITRKVISSACESHGQAESFVPMNERLGLTPASGGEGVRGAGREGEGRAHHDDTRTCWLLVAASLNLKGVVARLFGAAVH